MNFSDEEMRKNAASGAFLKERLLGKTKVPLGTVDEKRFKRWQEKAGGSGGEVSFHNRLAAEYISWEHGKLVAESTVWNEKEELPYWTEKINKCLNLLPVEINELQDKIYFNVGKYLEDLQNKFKTEVDGIAEIREIIGSLSPFIYEAEENLKNRITDQRNLFSYQSMVDISTILATGLYSLIYKIWKESLKIFILRRESFGFLTNMGKADIEHYRILFSEDLLAGGWKELLANYPVVGRFITTMMDNWVNNMADLAVHLEADGEKLTELFNKDKSLGKVVTISGNISDAHSKGKGVMILQFECGIQIVYKPRNLGLDIAYERLVKKLEQMNFPYLLKAPKVLARKEHGWIEFIPYQDLDCLEGAEIYYRRVGALLCLVYFLGGNDFHGENIIANGNQPVLIDLETIISYKMIQFHEEFDIESDVKGTQNFVDLLQESVLGIGFLPIWIKNNDDIVDFGALTGTIPTSIPGYEGVNVEVFSYESQLSEGFRKAYDFFIHEKQSLLELIPEIFNETILRIILRPTNVYARMLFHSLNPEFLRDGFFYSVEMERMAPAFLIKVEEEKIKKLWPIFLAEREALEGRDIPIFYGRANERHIYSGDNVLSQDYFPDSAVERLSSRMRKIGEEDRKRQLDFIRESLIIHRQYCHNEGEKIEIFSRNEGTVPCTEIILEQAYFIFQQIMSERVEVNKKNLGWIVYQYDLIHKRTYIGQTTPSLYDGFPGIALLSGALFQITGEIDFKKKALQLMSLFRENLRDPNYPMPIYRMATGLGNGLGGLIQTFLCLFAYTGDNNLLRDVTYLVDNITEVQLKKDKQVTIYTGLAGLIPGLLNVYKETGGPRSLELAVLCGHQILKKKNSVKNTGWSDGKAGLIFSLAKLYHLTGENKFKYGILEMFESEKKHYESIQLQIEERNLNASLCNGLTGVGMMGLALHEARIEEASVDLELLIQILRSYPMDYGDHFCCGNSGRLEFLLEAGLSLDKPDLCHQVSQDIQTMIDRKNQQGNFHVLGIKNGTISNPSFFQGLSGIGYLFLRSLNSEKIHSILI